MTRNELERDLVKLGLQAGDIVLLHSALSSLGHLEGGADALIKAFLNVLGDEGTLVVPSFTSGAVPEAVKKHPQAVESIAPTAQVAAIGAQAHAICDGHWQCATAHGPGTPYMKIAQLGGYVCLLGVDQDRNTTLHSAEAELELPYLRSTDPREIDTPEGAMVKSFAFFPGPHRDFIGLDRLLARHMTTAAIGPAVARLIRSRDLIDIAVAAGRQDPAFVLCVNPACADCVRQRAQLRIARLRQEKFTLACSSLLAGRYIPEMIENCKAAGIEHIELDCVQGMPVHTLSTQTLARHAAELREAQIHVASLRSATLPEDFSAFLDKAHACGVERVVLPLTSEAPDVAAAASSRPIDILFTNLGLSSTAASQQLLALKKADLPCGFAFHAANFARAGEKPFLESFKRPCRRLMHQLEIADALHDGRATALAAGNAEIKELISILRCAGFAGTFVLGEDLRSAGSLQEAVEAFWALMDAM